MATNGVHTLNGNSEEPLRRAQEVQDSADEDAATKHTGHGLEIPGGGPRTALVEHHPPQKLDRLLNLGVKNEGGGKDALIDLVDKVLKYSVNTWDQGFLDKLYASTNAVGLVSELLLATLNTNVHVYQVSPVLTLIEKHVTTYLASLFNFPSPHAGGISQPGGSASNSTAIVIARNTLFPDTKTNGLGSHRFTLFTSAHGHYSLEKAAQIQGLGSKAVISVPVDESGAILPSELERLVNESKDRGETPFFVNSTAGTTVLGSFDPFDAISKICKTHNLWLHIDGSWGGPVIFSQAHADTRLKGAELADSLTINPHKMLGVPVTCSFLLGRDMRQFWKALTLPAGYLFHNEEEDGREVDVRNIYDLADLTPQCGRRADALKFYLALTYYGAEHFSELITTAYDKAEYLLGLLKRSPNFVVISPEPLPALQVCFYFARGGVLSDDQERNGDITASITQKLVSRGFMIDFAPGQRGKFFRVVVNGVTRRGTLDGLVKAIEETAKELGY